MLRNVLDFEGTLDQKIANALASPAVASGDRLYIPALPNGAVWQVPAGGWLVTKDITIFGDGPGSEASGGTRLAGSASPAVFHIQGPALSLTTPHIRRNLVPVAIRDLCIVGTGAAGDGIRFEHDTPPRRATDSCAPRAGSTRTPTRTWWASRLHWATS